MAYKGTRQSTDDGMALMLTIDDKILTTNFSEITLDGMRAHAQLIQEERERTAWNSTMLLTCLKASITNTVYTKSISRRNICNDSNQAIKELGDRG